MSHPAAARIDDVHLRVAADHHTLCARFDRGFAILIAVEAALALLLAWLVTPHSWAGTSVSLHTHVIAALLLGGGIAGAATWLVRTQPGEPLTRHVIAAGVMLLSALFIHIGGGHIEVHFSVFVSLAFLGAYRDGKVLLTATVVIAADHLSRGLLLPRSVFGSDQADLLRVLEHAAYVVLEVAVLLYT